MDVLIILAAVVAVGYFGWKKGWFDGVFVKK